MNQQSITQDDNLNRGISPIIGVILIVAVTVVLGAVIGASVLDIGSNIDDTAQAGVQFDNTQNGTETLLISNNGYEQIQIYVDGEPVEGAVLQNTGDSVTVTSPNNTQISAVGTTSNGTSQIIQSIISSSDTTSGTGNPSVVNEPTELLTGTVSVNPPVEGAQVISKDSNGNTIDTTTTNADGEYEINATTGGTIKVTARNIQINGTPFYGTFERTVADTNSQVNFDFQENQTTIDNQTVLVANSVEQSSENRIYSVEQLQNINNNLTGDYKLMNDIDASDTQSWDGNFQPISDIDNGVEFSGSFNGQGYTISNLTIDKPNTNNVGLFGGNSGEIKNVGVVNASVTGATIKGVLVGFNTGSVSNSYAEGDIGSTGSSTPNINRTGGLVGVNAGSVNSSYANVNISEDTDNIGGLVGANATGGSISDSYATGDVSGQQTVGGFVGVNTSQISNSYATGDVSGQQTVGGFVAGNTGQISDSYSIGDVSGDSDVGGFAGLNDGSISSSYWDDEEAVVTESGQVKTGLSSGGTPLTTSEMTGSNATSNMSELFPPFEVVESDYPELPS